MGKPASRGVLYVVVCAAPPAAELQDLVKLAQAAGWEVAVTATPDALAFIDAVARHHHRLSRPPSVAGA
jgi:malonyl CoA-acyl carrier protein transacylase